MPDKFTADDIDDQPIQYSLGRPSERTGIGGLSAATTGVIAGGGLLFIFMAMSGKTLIGAVVVVPLTVIIAALVGIKISGRSLIENMVIAVFGVVARARGAGLYVAGPFSRVPGGRRRLPGLLARTETVSGVDGDGREFTAVVDRPRKSVTVVFDCQMSGQTAQTQAERNAATAEWSRWLSELSLSGDIEQAVVVIGSRPGTGNLIAREVSEIRSDSAPQVARQIMSEAAAEISVGIPDLVSHIAITFKVEAVKGNVFMEQLANRLPQLYSSLSWAGILAEPMTEEALVARVHSFFNPAAEADFEALHIADTAHEIDWHDAGPSVAVAHPNSYYHDGCYSVTWEMREGPRSTFEDRILTSLIRPHDRITRKRVALIYRPFEAGQGARRVESEHKDALAAANSTKALTAASAQMRIEHTEAARRAQARGAQLGRYSLWVTATVDDRAQLPRVRQEIEHLGAASSVRLDLLRNQQDAGFEITCGMGQVPWGKQTTKKAALQFTAE